MFPDFGKAGMPYAKSCRSVKALHGAKPDPGLLFDRKSSRELISSTLLTNHSTYAPAGWKIQGQSRWDQ